MMSAAEKACPIIIRRHDGRRQVLAFAHPLAGRQFVKGGIETGESPRDAAVRELREESGLIAPSPPILPGVQAIGADRRPWHFLLFRCPGLPDRRSHRTGDDSGHDFAFFWHPLDRAPDETWHPIFNEAFAFFAPLVASR